MHDRGVKCGHELRRRTGEDGRRERERGGASGRDRDGKTMLRERAAEEESSTYAKMGGSYFGWE